MKKVIFIFAIVLNVLFVNGQSNIRLNNYWGNLYYINPSSVYDKYIANFSLAVRDQWRGVEGAPQTLFASANSYFEKIKSQFGLTLLQDKIGYTYTTNLNFAYAYAVALNWDWKLNLGMGFNYVNLSYDLSKIDVDDNEYVSTTIGKLKKQTDFDVDIGVELAHENLRLGAVSQNILSSDTLLTRLQSNTNIIYAKYRTIWPSVVNLGLGVFGIQYSNVYQLEANLVGHFKAAGSWGLLGSQDLFDLGFFYRTKREAGILFAFYLSKSLYLSYSYNFLFGSLGKESYGTNEIMLTYNMSERNVCHQCWY